MARGGGSGGRSGGGTFGGSRSGGGFNPFPGGMNDRGYHPPMGGGIPGGGFGTGMRPGGCGCGLLIAVIIIILVIVLILSIGSLGGGGYTGGSCGFGSSDITKSTVVREALPPGSVNETGYYSDGLNVIKDRNALLEGMEYFYQETGVQPYLYLTGPSGGFGSGPSMEELDDLANGLYDELFTDEAHLILVYYEYENSYVNYYLTGAQAKTVIDEEAGDILLDYLDRYYYDESLTYEEFFSKVFRETADRIMTVTRSPWIPVLIVLGVVLLAVLLFVWWLRAKKQRNLEAKQTEDILNIPLDKFGTTEAEELAKKYDEKNNPKD